MYEFDSKDAEAILPGKVLITFAHINKFLNTDVRKIWTNESHTKTYPDFDVLYMYIAHHLARASFHAC